jgi:hypothetical protein
MSATDQRRIHQVPISGAIRPTVPARHYATEILDSVVAQGGSLQDVILIDFYGSGNSKAEYKTLLMACEPYTKAPKGSFSKVSQIAIVDAASPNPEPVSQVPYVDYEWWLYRKKGLLSV